jgi:hypothetical protein
MGRSVSKLLRNYINSADNKQQLCRREHDAKTIEERDNLPEVPDARYMIDTLVALRGINRLRRMAPQTAMEKPPNR